ncbi:DUF6919 domain-containing protein [Streptomyces yunnanensis]|uniref:DUF6919 domain-containing protein n=1 Tax=Streptomyces yunnanensis TaxID=156453 RepID=A0A9X8MT98_9ACTN|nr:hypothetical protein [Streptomyces yunnanensis]SHL75116.1 hypothetical protein SAMN05216268_10672 [Streptomyces yunnanensis]
MNNPWKKASTVADLGRLMAEWLEGRIPTWPGYMDTRPDDETRHLIPTLAAACRAGYVTTGSQPGLPPGCGYDGRTWRQRAAVEGWIADPHLLNRIRAGAERAGITVIANRPGQRSHPGMPVTEAGAEVTTDFGWSPGHRRLIASMWRGIGRPAERELREATHLTLVDPEWGRDNWLWPALAHATNR